MRRDSVTLGRKTLSYLIVDPAGPAVRQRPANTVVLLHAFPLHAAMWESTVASMPEGWRAVAPDYRGDGGVRTSDLAGDVVDLLDHLGVTQAAVVGCSMGGYVLFEILKSASRYVKAVGLVSTRPGADNEEGKANRQKMIALVGSAGVEAVADQMVPKLLGATTQRERPELPKQLRNLILENPPERVKGWIGAMMERGDSTPLLAKIDVPALVVHGAEDVLIPPGEAEGMHRAITNSQLELLPQSGHLPNLEQAVPFERILWPFLNKI